VPVQDCDGARARLHGQRAFALPAVRNAPLPASRGPVAASAAETITGYGVREIREQYASRRRDRRDHARAHCEREPLGRYVQRSDLGEDRRRLTIAAGTYAGGWRIIRTLGQRIYKLQPEHGFAAQLSAGSTLYVGTHFGFPISTTHVVTGSIMGAGAVRHVSAVKWGVAGNILFAWLLTLPAAGLVAAALYYPVFWIL
jgi:hypothetical protein